MKKVGLTVCYDTKNYGSQLQVLATITKIEQIGYKTEIIRYKKKISPYFIVQNCPRILNPFFVKAKVKRIIKNKKIKKDSSISNEICKRNKRFSKFADEKFKNLSRVYNGWNDLKKSNNDYDEFLCGSDQLWLPNNLGSHFYTLEFVDNEKKKIAYATSFGVKSIPWYQKNRTKKYLNRFDFLSNREISGSKIVKELTGKESKVVCDPTLLLTAKEWEKIISHKKVEKEKYIFCYFLGTNKEHREAANKLKEITGFNIVTIPFLDNFVESDKAFGDKRLYDIDTIDFVNYIRNAEYVLTDSFHGSIFSILNNKQFITFDRFNDKSKDSRNTRIDSLFSILNIKNRRFNGDINKIFEKIDYDDVEKKLSKLREDSIDYLLTALK